MSRQIVIDLPRPHAAQQSILDGAARFNVGLCGRRFGKTTLIQELTARPALAGYPVGLFVPRYKQVLELWRDLTGLFGPVIKRQRDDEKRIELIVPGGIIEAWTLEDPDAGRSRKYKRIIVDEAGLQKTLRERWSSALRSTLADYRGDAYFFGTPKGKGTDFEYFANRAKTDRKWRFFHFPTSANPYISADEIADMRAELSDMYAAQEIDAEFVDLNNYDPFLAAAILWDRLRAETRVYRNQPMVVALDAGVSSDTFAMVATSRDPDDDEIIVERHTQVWVPPVDGDLDFAVIEDDIIDFLNTNNVVQLTYDPYQLHHMAGRLREYVVVDPFNQGNERLEADRALLDRINSKRLVHTSGHSLLREHLLNASRKVDADGRRLRIVKPGPDKKIDAAVALSMSVHRCARLNLY